MRIVFHVDMDAFFASVEEREKPWLKGKPVVVGADPKHGTGRGVVSTANYQARAYGIHSAMPISEAWRCSEKAVREGKIQAVFLGGDWRQYAETSNRIMVILRKYAEHFEPASIDEAYLQPKFPIFLNGRAHPRSSAVWLGRAIANFQFLSDEWNHASRIAKQIKAEILRKERITCSIGIGPNKLIAKIASGRQKPDGLSLIRPAEVENFLAPLSVREIPGIGPKAEAKFLHRGVRTVIQLRAISRNELIKSFGAWGGDMYEKARGVDEDPVIESHETKSIGEQETFEQDTRGAGLLIESLQKMARSVFGDVQAKGFVFRTVSVTVRFSDFETKTRTHTRKNPIRNYKTFDTEVLKIFLPFLDKRENPTKKPIRLVGVRAEHLSRQEEFF